VGWKQPHAAVEQVPNAAASEKDDKQIIVGLDIGTSKVVAIVGELSADGSIEVIGIGSHPSRA
jgi:cell division ATPase FtsA